MLKTMPPPEDLASEQFYAFTLNLKNPLGAFTWNDLYKSYIKKLGRLSAYCYFKMYPEFSSQAKLHYHGFLVFKNYASILPAYIELNNIEGAIKLDTIDDYTWKLYVKKQKHIMQPFMHKWKLPYCIQHRKCKRGIEGLKTTLTKLIRTRSRKVSR